MKIMAILKKAKADYVLFALVLILMIFGLVMITSIGVSKSVDISAHDVLYPSCSDANVDCYLLFKNHFIRLIFGSLALLIASKISFRFWKKISVVLFGITVLILFLVLILGSSSHTFAKSWLVLFNTSLQPIEFAKLALIFYLANWMEKKSGEIGTFQYGFLPFCIVTGVMILPILLQPDLGGTLVVGIIAVAMFFAAGARVRHLAVGAFAVLLMGIIVVTSVGHVRDRFQAYFSGDKNCKEDYCWQSEQANIAVGSGGFWGKGLTQGVQKADWLPQASDDFIFAASAEELGFLLILAVVVLYAAIGYRGFKIANHAPNRFTMLTAVGITTWIVAQAFINIAVNLALMPVTGITLPFVSYGGSSLLSVLIAMGILLNISKNTTSYASNFERGGNGGTHNPKYRSYSRT